MSAPDAKAATGVLFDCADVESMMKSAMNKSGTIPQQMMKCVDQVMTEENLNTLFTPIFQGKQDAAQKALTTPLLSCAKGSAGQ